MRKNDKVKAFTKCEKENNMPVNTRCCEGIYANTCGIDSVAEAAQTFVFKCERPVVCFISNLTITNGTPVSTPESEVLKVKEPALPLSDSATPNVQNIWGRKKNLSELIDEAVDAFEKNNIYYQLKNPATGHFHCYRIRDSALFQYYAGTGTITGHKVKGLRALLNILTEGGKF